MTKSDDWTTRIIDDPAYRQREFVSASRLEAVFALLATHSTPAPVGESPERRLRLRSNRGGCRPRAARYYPLCVDMSIGRPRGAPPVSARATKSATTSWQRA